MEKATYKQVIYYSQLKKRLGEEAKEGDLANFHKLSREEASRVLSDLEFKVMYKSKRKVTENASG